MGFEFWIGFGIGVLWWLGRRRRRATGTVGRFATRGLLPTKGGDAL